MRNQERSPLLAAATALALVGGLAVSAAPAAFADEALPADTASAEAAPAAIAVAPSAPADPVSHEPAPVEEPAEVAVAAAPAVPTPAEAQPAVAEPVAPLADADPNPPKVVNTTPTDGAVYKAGTKITIGFECVDPDDAITYCGVYGHTLGEVWTLEPGSYHWRFYANNARVNTITNVFFDVLPYDTTAPTVTIDRPAVPASGWYTGDTYIGFTGHDDSGDVKHVMLEFENGTIRRSDGALLGHWFSEGVTNAKVYAIDGSNNAGVGQPITVKIDKTAPAITIESPVGPFEVGDDIALDYYCIDTLSGLADCTDNSVIDDKLDTRAPGDYAIDITSTDHAGNSRTESFTYTVLVPDTDAPRIQFDIQAPNAAGWYDGPLDALLWAQDGDGRGVKAIDWSIDGPAARSGSTTVQEHLAFNEEGVHTLTATATDAVGNRSATAEFVVRIDDTDPIVDDATKLTFVQGSAADFSSLCSDATSGVVDCGIVDVPLLAAAPGATDVLGEHTVWIGATDAAGNTAEAEVTYEVVAAPVTDQPRPTQPGQAATDVQSATLAFTGAGVPTVALLWAAVLIVLGAAGIVVVRRARA
ncbi:MAG TPA: hypothetical protein VN200_01435 [Rhodoglobus sp.]|nr:hypothetical protein [Rhodoglobus sp.]